MEPADAERGQRFQEGTGGCKEEFGCRIHGACLAAQAVSR